MPFALHYPKLPAFASLPAWAGWSRYLGRGWFRVRFGSWCNAFGIAPYVLQVYARVVPHYRRHLVAGATYFFTVNLLDRNSSLLVDEIGKLRHAVARVRALMPFHIDGWVVLPDHMHCLWTLPEDDGNFPRRWQAIKTNFSRRISGGEPLSASRLKRGERGIWQRRYWEHTIRDERDYAAHLDYIHFNPVKHGYVASPADWKFSSFHRSVRQGLYPAAWAGPDGGSGAWGERG